MKRIIDGKRYDTDTAEMICDVSSRINDQRDFKWHDTQLYRTKKGAWFVAGEGGPMSRWAHDTGDGYGYGSGLVVIEADEARELLEQHDELDALAEYFNVEDA